MCPSEVGYNWRYYDGSSWPDAGKGLTVKCIPGTGTIGVSLSIQQPALASLPCHPDRIILILTISAAMFVSNKMIIHACLSSRAYTLFLGIIFIMNPSRQAGVAHYQPDSVCSLHSFQTVFPFPRTLTPPLSSVSSPAPSSRLASILGLRTHTKLHVLTCVKL